MLRVHGRLYAGLGLLALAASLHTYAVFPGDHGSGIATAEAAGCPVTVDHLGPCESRAPLAHDGLRTL